MRSDDHGDWQDSPRGRRRRHDPDPDARYQRGPRHGSRDVRERPEDHQWNTGPGGQGPADPYRDPLGSDRDWTGEHDPYGRTDPGGSGYYGGQPYDPHGDYPSQPPLPRGDYPGQPLPRGDYPSQPLPRGDYPSQPLPRGDYPSQPPGDYGYGQDPYGQPYDDRQWNQGQPGYEGRPAYDAQDPYNGRGTYGEPDAYGGHDAYTDGRGYAAGGYPPENGYPEGQAGYEGQPYDSYGAARSGPMPAYSGDDQPWHEPQDPPGTGAGYDQGSRRDRRAAAYAQQQAGQDAAPVGSRRSARGMDADDERHSGFFAGYASNDDDHYGRGGGGRKQRRGRGRAAGMIALFIVLALLGGLGFTGWHFYREYKSAHASYTGNGYGTVDVIVQPGATAVSIAPKLVKAGVIAAVDPFVAYVNGSKNPTGLQPGEFKMHKHMGNPQAWAMLTDSKNRVNSTVTIPDGLPIKKILPLLAKSSHLPLSDFQAAIKETSKLGLPSWANGNPEGFLYPDTYDVVPGSTTALQILQTAVHQFNVEISQVSLAATAQKDQFTELQIITEASLLEGEVGPKYYADVARTLDNRLKIGMPLQLDSTIAFITGDYSYTLSAKERHTPSPYNTFLHADLPPGPINSPSLAAIKAALHPASSSNNWVYFITINKSGLTKFTNSYSQFLTWSNEAKQNGV